MRPRRCGLRLLPLLLVAAAPAPQPVSPGKPPLTSTLTSPGRAPDRSPLGVPDRASATPATLASDSDRRIEALEAALLHAPDADHADAVAARLAEARMQALSPTTRLMLRRAQRELDQNRGQDALGDAGDAIALQPDRAIPWRERASIEGALGDADDAVRDLGGALSRDPADAESWAGLAAIAEKTGRYDRAVEAWQHVLLLCPALRNGAARLRTLKREANGDPT